MHHSYNINLSDLATSFSVIIALIAFLWDRKKTRAASEIETFDSLNDKWTALLEKSVEYPDIILDFGENKASISQAEKKRTIYCHILLSTLEMAYLKYGRASRRIRREQWWGWDVYIEQLFTNPEIKKQLFTNPEIKEYVEKSAI